TRSRTAAWSDASTRLLEKRSGSASRSTARAARAESMSATVMWSWSDRCCAIAAIADPTPPAPTTRILTRPGFHAAAGKIKSERAQSVVTRACRLTEREENGTNRLALRRTQAQPSAAIPRRGPVRGPRQIDALDQGIIEALQTNGRESFRRIAERLGVSEATVRARYAKLAADDILQVVAVTNPLGLGFDAMALVAVRTSGAPYPGADEISTW